MTAKQTAERPAREAVIAAQSVRTPTVVRLERLTLVGMAIGAALMLQPWWAGGMRAGFFVTLASTLAQIVLGHMAEDER